MAAFEERERSLFEILIEAGVSLPPPHGLEDAKLSAKLWEVIDSLALHATFLDNTDHLSDQQLYAELWNDLLHEPFEPIPEGMGQGFFVLDLVGSGSEEDIYLHLKHYADEKYRLIWREDWPEDPMPDHEDPPYDRDRLLPQPEQRKVGPLM
jgi:hypothetical protein